MERRRDGMGDIEVNVEWVVDRGGGGRRFRSNFCMSCGDGEGCEMDWESMWKV